MIINGDGGYGLLAQADWLGPKVSGHDVPCILLHDDSTINIIVVIIIVIVIIIFIICSITKQHNVHVNTGNDSSICIYT